MNTKKITISLIFTILISLITIAFYSLVNFVLMIFTDLANALSGEGAIINDVSIIIVLALIISVLGFVNIVMSAISLKYTRSNGVNFEQGKKKILTLAILLLINAVINIAFMILTFDSILLMLLIMLFTVSFVVIAIVLLVGVKKININQENLIKNNIDDK